jgi:hypothetical protein
MAQPTFLLGNDGCCPSNGLLAESRNGFLTFIREITKWLPKEICAKAFLSLLVEYININ